MLVVEKSHSEHPWYSNLRTLLGQFFTHSLQIPRNIFLLKITLISCKWRAHPNIRKGLHTLSYYLPTRLSKRSTTRKTIWFLKPKLPWLFLSKPIFEIHGSKFKFCYVFFIIKNKKVQYSTILFRKFCTPRFMSEGNCNTWFQLKHVHCFSNQVFSCDYKWHDYKKNRESKTHVFL